MRILLLLGAGVLLSGCGKVGIDKRDEHGMTALMRAARDGNRAEVQRLLGRGADVNAVVPSRDLRELIAFLSWMQQLPKSDVGFTPLHYAAQGKQPDIARLLIAKGASRTASGRAGMTPLELAILQSDLPTVEALSDGAPSPNAHQMWLAVSNASAVVVAHLLRIGGDVKGMAEPFAGGRPRPPLAIEAAQRGDPEVMRLLIQAGVDLGARDQNGWTALRYARGRGGDPRSGEMAALLERTGPADLSGERASALFAAMYARDLEAFRAALAAGANANARSDNGVPVLVLTAQAKDGAPFVAALVDAGALVNVRPVNGTTPLIAAVESGNVESVRKLLSAGANVTLADHIKRTPLQVASGWKHPEITRILLDAGAPPDPRALAMAALAGGAEQVKALLAAGADVNAGKGHALSEATRGCHRNDNTEVIRVLLDAGADPRIFSDISPLHRAVGMCPLEVTRMLLARGADPNARDINEHTVIDYAKGKPEVIELLRRAGAK